MRRKLYEVKTLDEAKRLAVADFGIKESELTFTVVNEKKGFLGIGSKIEVEAIIDADGITKGKEYIQTILDNNGVKGFIEKKVRGKNVEFNIEAGEFNGNLIGKNARNLIALQTLVGMVVNNYYEGEELKAVYVDVGGYKKRRERNLESMAVQFGKQVARSKQKIQLDYLNAYERKIIHNKLATWKDVTTFSVGEEPNRFLVIEPKSKKER
ncbi:MAG: Jag N-terminal domain-containing protein [Bacilli bacterium]|nr:Jag N-terminal domain-containing protein [Bacilli bacterium]